MKLEKWALIAEIVSGVAIVVTLVILIFEVRGNTSAVQIATIDNVTSGWVGLNQAIVSDPQVARAFIVGLYNPDALTDAEAVQFSMYLRMFANQVVRVEAHYELGLIPKSDYETALRQMAWLYDTPGGQLHKEADPAYDQFWGEKLPPYIGLSPWSDLMLGRDTAGVE